MPVPDKLKQLVDQMPDPDGRGMYTENIDKDKIDKAVAEIAVGGRQNVEGLIEMLGEPGSAENVKPHYALHCVVNHALIARDENARRQCCEAMAAALSGELSTYNKAYLCQELQWAGRKESASALGKLLTDPELCNPAAMALAAIGDGAADPLRAAWPKAEGPCRLAVADALAALADRGSVTVFQEALRDKDGEVRVAGAAGLAGVGDAGSTDALLKAADCPPGWERVQMTKQCMVLAEKLMAAGQKDQAVKIYQHLQQTRTDPSENYIRLAAAKAMAAA